MNTSSFCKAAAGLILSVLSFVLMACGTSHNIDGLYHGVAGGPKKFTVHKNAHVVLVVHSTIGEAVHLHGYDIEKPIRSKTVPVRLPFVAKVSGVFEIELHLTETRGLRIALLTVK